MPEPEQDVAGRLAAELPGALGPFVRTLRRAVRARSPLPPLPDAQVAVLRVVQGAPGATVGQVAQRLGLAPNTVSMLVRELTAAGLLVRERSAADRRAVALVLSGSAVRRLADWDTARAQLLGEVVTRLDAAEQDALLAALPAVRRLLDELHREAPGGQERPPGGGGQERARSRSSSTLSAATGPDALVQ